MKDYDGQLLLHVRALLPCSVDILSVHNMLMCIIRTNQWWWLWWQSRRAVCTRSLDCTSPFVVLASSASPLQILAFAGLPHLSRIFLCSRGLISVRFYRV